MVKIERSFPAPESLAIEAKKKSGSYEKRDVVERLIQDFHNKCYISPLYNFKNSTLVAESTILGHGLTILILYGFRYFSRNEHKIPVPVSDCLTQTGIPVRFYPDTLKILLPGKAVFSWHSRRY